MLKSLNDVLMTASPLQWNLLIATDHLQNTWRDIAAAIEGYTSRKIQFQMLYLNQPLMVISQHLHQETE